MTKLEELKAAGEAAAYDAAAAWVDYAAARYAPYDAAWVDYAAARDAPYDAAWVAAVDTAWAAYAAARDTAWGAWDAWEAARDAHQAELKKVEEGNSND